MSTSLVKHSSVLNTCKYVYSVLGSQSISKEGRSDCLTHVDVVLPSLSDKVLGLGGFGV